MWKDKKISKLFFFYYLAGIFGYPNPKRKSPGEENQGDIHFISHITFNYFLNTMFKNKINMTFLINSRTISKGFFPSIPNMVTSDKYS